MKLSLLNNSFVGYLLKFGLAFCALYFGTLAVIGLSSPDNFYSGFVAHYLNYIAALRASLMLASKAFLIAIGYSIHLQGDYIINIVGGGSVRIVYSCIGYGVMSFWGAFILANKGSWVKKLKWIFGGWLAIWLINIARISFLLLSGYYHWPLPLGWDHHTWFNILAYGFIFGLIYFYDRSQRKEQKKQVDKSWPSHSITTAQTQIDTTQQTINRNKTNV